MGTHTETEPSSASSTWALAVILAIIFGALLEDFSGLLIGAVLGALLAQVLSLRSRLQALHARLRVIEGQGRGPARAPAEEAQARPPAQPAAAVGPARTAPASPAAGSPATSLAAANTQSDPVRQRTHTAQPSALEKRIGELVAWFKGGNPLARAGIVVLFFGGAFLAKYAADHSLFPVELRFMVIALGALALLVVGWRLREKRTVYAQLLQGGGIAGLYLTVFAATRLFELLPLGFALALMVVVALAAAVLAVAQNALSLAVIATAGGFLAPILVSTGGGNHVALFTYYAVLNLGVFAVAWFRTWRVLNVVGFVFTFAITGLWRVGAYQPADLVSADFFLILFFLLYVGISILNALRQAPDLKGYVSGSLMFGLPVIAFTLQATLITRIEYGLALSALTLGTFYLALAWLLFRTRRTEFRLLVEAFAALGVVFASLAIPLAFDTHTTAAMWAVEGAGLLWLGVRQQRRLARIFGALLQVGAGIGYLIGFHGPHGSFPVLNSALLGALMLAVSGLTSSYWLFRNEAHRARYESGADVVFALWGTAWWLLAGLREIDAFVVQQAQLGAGLTFVAATAGLLTWLAIDRGWRLPQRIALYLPAVFAIPVLLQIQILELHPFARWGAVGWLALLAVHYAMLWLIEGARSIAVERDRQHSVWLHAGAWWTVALIAAWEGSWHVAQHTAGVWPVLPWGLMPALLLALVGRRELRPAWPLKEHADTYRTRGAAPLAVLVVMWIFAVNLSNRGDPIWLPYVPVVNPLDVCVALCFAALALWWTSLDGAQRARLWRLPDRALPACTAGLLFLWLNSALIRALHHNWGAPLTFAGAMNSTLVQASLSIFWGLLGFGAMTVAARKTQRTVWLAGAALMIVVIAKLFLIDLSNSGTVARIASFLTVGVLLLITGYLAPLPPRKRAETHHRSQPMSTEGQQI